MKLFVNVHDIYGINTMDVDPRNIYEDVRNALQKQFPDVICDGACNFILSAKSIQAEAQNWNENLHKALNTAVENYKKTVKYNSQLACDGKMLPLAIRTLSMAVREMDDEFSPRGEHGIFMDCGTGFPVFAVTLLPEWVDDIVEHPEYYAILMFEVVNPHPEGES